MKSKTITNLHLLLLLFFITGSVNASATGGRDYWQSLENQRVVYKGERLINAVAYRSFRLDQNGLKSLLATAPELSASTLRSRQVVVSIPMPGGQFADFAIFKTEVMHPSLAARYPMITTYAGQGITDPQATARFDFTQFGFHGLILTPSGTWFIDPYSLQDQDHYMVYYKKDFFTSKERVCHVTESSSLYEEFRHGNSASSVAKSIGTELKTYRLAMAATGEYTAFYGGTVAGALAGIVTSVNRVSGIYEREFAIRMTLIPNTDTLIFTNANTDPYTNNNGGTMLGQNQTTVNSYIGTANYDIGHVFSTGGGGIAGLGVVCSFSNKARGVTGSSSPINDPFDVDYVAHEIGHQYGGNHTFNCEVSACGGGNRAYQAAYEPGSGSTIMAYAGICGNNNLQSNSDDYFHTKSFDEVTIYTIIGQGNLCDQITPTGNTPPVINPMPNYIIPYLTPFRLTGDAYDPDGDPITYCWEQYNLGPAGTWNNPSGNAPIFRSFDPVSSPTRLFPRLINILNNNVTVGEIKPSYSRTLSFKLTVRDNRLNGGGVTNNDTLVNVEVINTGQAFAVTSPNVTGITWQSGGVATVTWDVGGSDLSPINTPLVNILLSTDGGQTFPTVLASQVPNNGSYSVNVPSVTTTTARVMVEGHGNIFFDINDKNFAIGTVGIGENPLAQGVGISPNPFNSEFDVVITNPSLLNSGELTMDLIDITGRIVSTHQLLSERTRIALQGLSKGVYSYRIFTPEGEIVYGKVVCQ